MSAIATPEVAGTILDRLDRIADLLRDLIRNQEQEPDLDQTYVFTGTQTTAVVLPFQLPRGIHHAEITLQVATNQTTAQRAVVVLPGNVDLPTATNMVAAAGGLSSAGSAIVATMNGSVTARDYLDGSGWLTIYSGAGTGQWVVTVRVRSLDSTQVRAQRT